MSASVGALETDRELGWILVGASAATAAIATWMFARIAERRGWVDDGSDAPSRKLQARPVPPVGGSAILVACAVTAILAGSRDALAWIHIADVDLATPSILGSRRAWMVAAVLVAFAVGLCDDARARGLSPGRKLAGQMCAAAVLALAIGSSATELHWGRAGLWFVAGVVAQNAVNTFDNADGAAASISLLGFAAVAPLVAAALAGFLPFNLWIRRAGSSGDRGAGAPIAYLGDSGSHALGLLLLLHPEARLVLFLPLLDLARVAIVRARLGIAPWIGDRRHLAQRMTACGWSPTAAVAALCSIAVPVLAAGLAAGRIEAVRGLGSLLLLAGALVSALAYCAALRMFPARE